MINLNAATNAEMVSWNGPGGFRSDELNPSIDLPGTYIITATLANGCTIIDSLIIIEDIVAPQVSVMNGVLSCDNNQAQLLAVSDVTDIIWTGPNGFSSTEIDPIVTEPGDYTVTAIASNGCSTTEILNVNFSDIDIQVGEIIGSCEGVTNGIIILQNISGALPPFTIGGVNDDPVVVETFPFAFDGLFSGDYNLDVSSSDGCMSTVNVNLPEVPAGTLDIDVTTINRDAGQFELRLDYDGEIIDVLWASNPVLSCLDCPNPTVALTETSNFLVSIIDDQGCIAEAGVSLSLNPESQVNSIYLPNVMTISSTNSNNRFYPQGNFGFTSLFNMQIFDRWGNRIFHSEGERVNDTNSGWDGFINGAPAISGVYVYLIEITNEQGVSEVINGDITIIN